MSAVPFPALVLGGTSCLPSRVAFILSAKAGPAKATAAPMASVASVTLVFDMVLSLWTSILQQCDFGFIPGFSANPAKFYRGNSREYLPYWRYRLALQRWIGSCSDVFSLLWLLPA